MRTERTAWRVPMVLVAVLVGIAGSGCVTDYYGTSRAQKVAREREDMLLLQENIRRMEGRVEGLEMENENLRDELEYASRDAARSAGDQVQSLERSLDDLQQRVEALERARQKDKQEIIDKLTGKIAEIMQKSAAPARAQGRAAPSGYGYEHVVQPGETLSEIASAYGATISAVIEANDLANPDRLKVGQTLFIPE